MGDAARDDEARGADADLSTDPTAGLVLDIGDHVGGEERPRKPPKATLKLDELGALLEAAKDESPDIRAMILVSVSTGMRFCEVSALEWRDIDLKGASLRIDRSQVDGVVGPPKTESTRREVFLPRVVVDVLEAHKQWQEKNVPPKLSAGRVFRRRTANTARRRS